jgi:hypothetical protein
VTNIWKLGSNLGIRRGILGESDFHLQPSWCHKGDKFFLSMVFWGLSNAQFHYAAHEN